MPKIPKTFVFVVRLARNNTSEVVPIIFGCRQWRIILENESFDVGSIREYLLTYES